MNDGLLDPVIVVFVFTPLVVTIVSLSALGWKRMHNSCAGLDVPGLLLASSVRALPQARMDWGAAMSAELAQVRGTPARWRFALGCVRVALFSPSSETLLRTAGRNPVFGILAVALPPLGLPFIYFAAVIVETIGGSPFTSASSWSNPEVVMEVVKIILVVTLGCLAAGLPLGLVGWLRRERMHWLSATGAILSVCIFGCFFTIMHFLAGGD